jgi:hypothetical protein
VYQLLDLFGRDVGARPGFFPTRLGLRDGFRRVAIFGGFGRRARAIFRLEDVLKERHAAAAGSLRAVARLCSLRRQMGGRGSGVLVRGSDTGADAGTELFAQRRRGGVR